MSDAKEGEVERIYFSVDDVNDYAGFYVKASDHDALVADLRARLVAMEGERDALKSTDDMVMVEIPFDCALCQSQLLEGQSYRCTDAGRTHYFPSDCAANLAFVFDALEKAEAERDAANKKAAHATAYAEQIAIVKNV